MDFLRVTGENKLNGKVKISGAKNSALVLLALSILSKNIFTIQNIPNVADIKTFAKLLQNLGATTNLYNHECIIDSSLINETKAIYDIVRKMRASILVLGPLLARFRKCEVSLPGGCAIGSRPVDFHLKAMELLGANIAIKGGYIIASAKNGLKGNTIPFDKISVTGTSNAILAASLAKGKSVILNAAREPEVVQLCEVLKNCGIHIDGIGSSEISILGSDGELLNLQKTEVIPDRIEAGTYLIAGGITNSKITLQNVITKHLENIILKLEEIGFKLDYKITKEISNITINPTKKLNSFKIITKEYPGFPTDMQAQFMALATQCDGVSLIEENLFENRFMHVNELKRLGAKITTSRNLAQIQGCTKLVGADVMATDLRASSALVLASLKAQGTSNIHRIYHLDRGYEELENKLNALGANILRLKS